MAHENLIEVLLERHGRTYAAELGIEVERNTPSPLFRLLCASLLFSARIGADIAVAAARALADRGWTTPQKLAASSWEDRVAVLNGSGYARYDESTATMLGETTELMLERYDGDLRALRDEAERDPEQERALLREFKGVGDAGVDIFFREVQLAWDELHPFADARTLEVAEELGLPKTPEGLARTVSRADFPRLTAALVRVSLSGEEERVLAEARG